MGWASGSYVMNKIIRVTKKNVPDEKVRGKLYKGIIGALEDQDWDTQSESMGVDPAFDKVIRKMHPDWFEEEEDQD